MEGTCTHELFQKMTTGVSNKIPKNIDGKNDAVNVDKTTFCIFKN